MSELTEARWSVVSERGCEASGLNYEQALELMRRLTQEKVSGLSIVTAAAARRFTRASPLASQSTSSGTAHPKA